MAFYSSNDRGKTTDRSTSWSEWSWDGRGFWISSRSNEFGVQEYEYRYPEASLERTPRTLGETNLQQSLYPNVEPSHGNNSSSDQPGSYTTSTSTVLPSYTQQATSYFVSESSHGTSHNTSDLESSHHPSSISIAVNPLSRTLSPNSISGPISPSQSQGSSSYPTQQESHGSNDFEYMVQRTRDLTLTSPQPINEQGHAEMSTSGQLSWQKDGGRIRNPQPSQPFEQLDQRYQVIDTKRLDKFWRVGRVFMMLWTEPAKGYKDAPHMGMSRNGSHFSVTYLNGKAFSEIRRFVVIRKNYGNCICSPIHTYRDQATLKPNLPDASEHAIIYTSTWPPEPHVLRDSAGNIIQREELHKDPIRVIREGKDDDQDLSITSRLNYSKIYTVENYVRVLNIGIVHPNFMESLAQNSLIRASPVSSSSRVGLQRISSKDNSGDSQSAQTDVKSDHGGLSERGGKSKDNRRKKKESSSTTHSKPSGSGKRR
ncbi:hypothetical protein BKA65DRAFT_268549 [Rhexocercosporidium sp. MPI-PUGE-AT-0058]|nr:hypothetical protein BKA65DRAFT_268549 [Rhexocercosporidium sp. MPI-PUGE-AT-0058]